MERRRRTLLALTCCLIATALGTGNASAKPVGVVEHFPTGCGVGPLVKGPDGNLWFTCYKQRPTSGWQGMVGFVTPQGTVRKFSRGLKPNEIPSSIVLGADGNLWFGVEGDPPPGRERLPAIGRVTPSGQITVFRGGLDNHHEPRELIAAPDGNVWFTTFDYETSRSGIARITPQGQITVLGVATSNGALGPGAALGPDGNIWFVSSDAKGPAIGRITPGDAITEFRDGLGAGRDIIQIAAGADGNLWFTTFGGGRGIGRITPSGVITEFSDGLDAAIQDIAAGPDGNLWFTGTINYRDVIGRVTPQGQITEFSRCLNYRYPFSEPYELAAGPDGNLWFNSVTSRTFPSLSEPVTIGRITPSGKITQFRGGLRSPGDIVAGPDGRVWFSGSYQVERITPSTAPVNTVAFDRFRRAGGDGLARLRVQVPGPGILKLRQIALLLPHKERVKLSGGVASAGVASCGEASLPLQTTGQARERLRRKGSVRIEVAVTFTPTGGTSYTTVSTITLAERG